MDLIYSLCLFHKIHCLPVCLQSHWCRGYKMIKNIPTEFGNLLMFLMFLMTLLQSGLFFSCTLCTHTPAFLYLNTTATANKMNSWHMFALIALTRDLIPL